MFIILLLMKYLISVLMVRHLIRMMISECWGVCEIFLKSDSDLLSEQSLFHEQSLCSMHCFCSYLPTYTASFIPLKPCHYSKTKFMSCSKFFICHFNNLQSIFTRRSFQLKKPLCLLIHRIIPCRFYHATAIILSHLYAPLLILFIFLFPPQL